MWPNRVPGAVGLAYLRGPFCVAGDLIALPKIRTELMKTAADQSNCLQQTASPLRLQFGREMILVKPMDRRLKEFA
jgi:hypothetical protein